MNNDINTITTIKNLIYTTKPLYKRNHGTLRVVLNDFFSVLINSNFSIIILRTNFERYIIQKPPLHFFDVIDHSIMISWLRDTLFGYELTSRRRYMRDSFFGPKHPSQYVMRTFNYAISYDSENVARFITLPNSCSNIEFSFTLTAEEYRTFVAMFDAEYVQPKIKWIEHGPIVKYPHRAVQFREGIDNLREKIGMLYALEHFIIAARQPSVPAAQPAASTIDQ